MHLGLAGLLAWRASQQVPNTFSIAVNDYGLELLSAKPVDWPALLPHLIGEATHSAVGEGLEAEVLASLNATEMARRRFREIAVSVWPVTTTMPGDVRQHIGDLVDQRDKLGLQEGPVGREQGLLADADHQLAASCSTSISLDSIWLLSC